VKRIFTVIFSIWACSALLLVLLSAALRLTPPQILYYPALFGVVGLPLWFNRQRVTVLLQHWQMARLPKFLLLGYGMVLLEELFAALFNHLSEGFSWGGYLERIGQFWALNVFTFTGFIVGWYLLQRWLSFSPTEVFWVAGVAGLYTEHTYLFVFSNPIAFFVLAPLNILTYGLIISPAMLSMGQQSTRSLHPVLKYPLALVTLFACSIIPVIVLQVLRTHFPDFFPPRKFVS